ncbi:HD domain-containing protein [Natronomonas salina]|uniref:HD domain-containing protein n=1 Tax=Natronomonas salina TaxID=1710540 RepID=UPI0015B75D71|nr:HD domain-containing protein [Natronomonas salina]QLD87562.1 HD domain-containing protein [Natronomonas salina]
MSHPPADVDPLFEAVAAEMAAWLGDDATGHDLAHGWRVFHTAMELADSYPEADREVLGAAALVHDVHRAMGAGRDAYVHPEDSLEEVAAVLDDAGFPDAKRDAVLHCVALHEEYEYRGDRRDGDRIEVDLLRDADNLDAMGAVGVARCFAYSGAHDRPMWTPDSDDPSAVDHFHEKLLHLREEMHTDAAREVAESRHDFLVAFLERFEAEWYGRA